MSYRALKRIANVTYYNTNHSCAYFVAPCAEVTISDKWKFTILTRRISRKFCLNINRQITVSAQFCFCSSQKKSYPPRNNERKNIYSEWFGFFPKTKILSFVCKLLRNPWVYLSHNFVFSIFRKKQLRETLTTFNLNRSYSQELENSCSQLYLESCEIVRFSRPYLTLCIRGSNSNSNQFWCS